MLYGKIVQSRPPLRNSCEENIPTHILAPAPMSCATNDGLFVSQFCADTSWLGRVTSDVSMCTGVGKCIGVGRVSSFAWRRGGFRRRRPRRRVLSAEWHMPILNVRVNIRRNDPNDREVRSVTYRFSDVGRYDLSFTYGAGCCRPCSKVRYREGGRRVRKPGEMW